jgi:GNAT superfamily N-acetyltransferase
VDDAAEIERSRSINWERIQEFVGFGRRDAPVVFIGMEEGLKDASALDEDLAIRSTYENPVMDLKEAHRGIAGTDAYFDPDRAPQQPTWRVMADVMLRREGMASPTGTDRRRYRALSLGRSNGKTLLAELLPYPHPKSSDWLYAQFGKFETRETYEEAILPDRKRLLRRVLGEAEREVVVCYGKAHWAHYQDLFEGVTWNDVGPHRVGARGRTRIALTTHFSGRDFNTDKQLANLAFVALSRTEVRAPGKYAEHDLGVIEQLVRKGGEVDEALLPANLRRSRKIAVACEAKRFVSVCALKGDNPRHRRSVSANSGQALPESAPEFGYVFTEEAYRGRGYGSAACAALLEGLPFVYATTRTTNRDMRRILDKSGFEEIDRPWPSTEHPGELVTLWIRK